MIGAFALARPSTLAEIGALLHEHGDAAALYAGGTELLVLLKEGFIRPRVLVDVKRISEMAAIASDAGGVRIGATASHRAVERSTELRAACPLVSGVARHVANVRVRSVGTVGGNLAFADPHSDLATLFLVFDARVVLWSAAGEREISLAEFVRGPYETARRADEVLTAVRLARWPTEAIGSYMKFGLHERPTLGVAAMLVVGADRRIADARLAIGCVGARPERLSSVEARLSGMPVAEIAGRSADLTDGVAAGIDAVSDVHGSAEYKREMARVFVGRALGVTASRVLGTRVDARYPHTVTVSP
jgi:carbon-monoxide dehydrogenase medium subunit